MIFNKTIVTRYYALIASTMIIFILLGIITGQYLIKKNSHTHDAMPPLFIAKIIDLLSGPDKIAGIKKYINLRSGLLGPEIELIDAQAHLIFSTKAGPMIVSPDDLQSLSKPYDYKELSTSKHHKHHFPLQLIFKFHPRRPIFLVRLSGEPATYIKIIPSNYSHEKKLSILYFIFSIGILLVSLLLGVAVSLLLIYFNITKHAKAANQVIKELQNGNLKARFPITRMDEFGHAMLKFNQMAEEMEHIILTAKHSEKVRINLLQELTHDLKTPISSLKMMLETLETKDSHLDENLKKELLSLSRKEVDYFAKLMDDLLLLAQMSEPKYQIRQEAIDLTELLSEKLDDIEFRECQMTQKKIIKQFYDDNLYIYGDKHLLKRAFRNALENAVYHANQVVTVHIERIDSRRLKVIVQDDGDGISDKTIHTFGERLVSRKVIDEKGTKVSYGLGSVIIKTVCELHSAKLTIGNAINAANQVLGAKLEIELSYI